jgi:hypothetical protein
LKATCYRKLRDRWYFEVRGCIQIALWKNKEIQNLTVDRRNESHGSRRGTVVVEEDEGVADEDQRVTVASNHRHSRYITNIKICLTSRSRPI